jgi:hypothetical protein
VKKYILALIFWGFLFIIPTPLFAQSCTIGQACGQNCGAGGQGKCDECNGGWCNGGQCFTCAPESSQPSCKTTSVCGQSVTGNSPSDCRLVCKNGSAFYECVQSDNANCIATIGCSNEDYKCQTQSTTNTQVCTPYFFDTQNCRRCSSDGKSWGNNCSDYGSSKGSTEWCSCAQKCNDGVSLVSGNCSQASTVNQCQLDCKNCAKSVDQCGNTTYKICDRTPCQATGANADTEYRCYSDINNKCSGLYKCGMCAPAQSTVQKPVTVTGITVNGVDITPQAGAQTNFNLAISDLSKESDIPIQISVKYSNGTTNQHILNFHYKPPEVNETNSCLSSRNLPIPVPVLALGYYPPDPQDPKLLDGEETGWGQNAQIYGRTIAFWEEKTQQMINQGLILVNESTRYHGYKDPYAPQFLNYRVIDYKKYYQAIPKGYPLGGNNTRPNYGEILRNLNICDYVDNKGVKEVWMYGYHNENGIEPDESKMSSNYGDISNANPKDEDIDPQYRMPICNNSYVLYNFTYQPDGIPGNNLHNRGHQIENIINFADENYRWPANEHNTEGSLYWDDFSEYVTKNSPFVDQNGNRIAEHISSCGNIHYSPNWNNRKTDQYIYTIEKISNFDCESWNPDPSKTVYTQGNCSKWGCSDLGFYKWYMQNIPGYNNGIVYQGQKMRNWWEAMYDFNAFIDRGRSLFGDSIFCQDSSGKTTLYSVKDYSGSENIANQLIQTYGKPDDKLEHETIAKISVIPDTSTPQTTFSRQGIISPSTLPISESPRSAETTTKPTSSPTLSPTPSSKPASISLVENISKLISQALPTAAPKATIQPTLKPVSTDNLKTFDLNSDGVINAVDTSQFLQDWRSGVMRDLNHDGVMNTFDYSLLKKELSP